MFSKSDLTVSVKEMKAFGITLVSILGILGAGSIMVSNSNEQLDSSLIQCENNKEEYKEYFNKMYSTLNQRYLDVHIWEEFMNKTDKHMSALDNVYEVNNFAIRTGLVDTEYENKYLEKNVGIQKEMEDYMNDLNSIVSRSKVLTTDTRRVYDIRSTEYQRLLKDLRTFIKAI
ncbi:hypothetical protein UT300012_21720 [Paraclostridium bifermentans]